VVKKIREEEDIFLGFQKFPDGYVAALFQSGIGIFRLDKVSCKERLQSLKKQKLPYDQTLMAVKSWPTKKRKNKPQKSKGSRN